MRALYFLFGNPIAHSRSPAIYGRAFRMLGIEAAYEAVLFEDAAEAAKAARRTGAAGFNVTIPFKEAFVQLVDQIHPTAARIGAVNCGKREGDKLVGYNTDAPGLLRALKASGHDPAGAHVVIVGAGGSARAAAWALAAHASQITIVNRTESKARTLASLVRAAGCAAQIGTVQSIREATLVVHCTSVGLNTTDVPFDPALVKGALVDLVYSRTGPTELLRRFSGVKVDGIDVLVHQAIASLEIWLGRPQLDELAPALREAALA